MKFDNDEMFGYTSSSSQYEYNGIKDGELVDVLLLESTYPRVYLDELEKRNNAEKEKCEALNTEFKAIEPSHKEAGILWKYAVVFRTGGFKDDEEPSEAVFKPVEDGQLQEPRYICYGQITLYPPALLYQKGWNFQQWGGSVKLSKSDKPYINEMLPNAMVSRNRETGVKANEIPEGQEEKFATLVAKEKTRIIDWEELINIWNKANEKQCRQLLDKWFSKMYMLCYFDVDKNQFIYVSPEPGIKFRARVKKDKYINLEVFKYNSSIKNYEYFSVFNTYEVQPEDLQLAKKIIDLRNRMKAERETKRSKKPAVNKENYRDHLNDEDSPWSI